MGTSVWAGTEADAKARSKHPDRVLYERCLAAVDAQRFTVANLSLQTLVNSYPRSEYARKARRLLKDSRIAKCGESVSFTSECSGSAASAGAVN